MPPFYIRKWLLYPSCKGVREAQGVMQGPLCQEADERVGPGAVSEGMVQGSPGLGSGLP